MSGTDWRPAFADFRTRAGAGGGEGAGGLARRLRVHTEGAIFDPLRPSAGPGEDERKGPAPVLADRVREVSSRHWAEAREGHCGLWAQGFLVLVKMPVIHQTLDLSKPWASCLE